jgi:hypothetical protein
LSEILRCNGRGQLSPLEALESVIGRMEAAARRLQGSIADLQLRRGEQHELISELTSELPDVAAGQRLLLELPDVAREHDEEALLACFAENLAQKGPRPSLWPRYASDPRPETPPTPEPQVRHVCFLTHRASIAHCLPPALLTSLALRSHPLLAGGAGWVATGRGAGSDVVTAE